jgi:cholesterol oxidase
VSEIARLSSPIADLEPRYDVVVVGSGYGGAIAACRLAADRRSVCVLERGREIRPGAYPDTLARAIADVQVDHPGRHLFSPTALFDVRLNRDINVLVGCGLGGTSLINANVALRPEAWVFRDTRWPEGLRTDLRRLDRCFALATEELGTTEYPADAPALSKYAALEHMAASIGGRVTPAPINVAFTASAQDEDGGHCRLCGDCVTGCNYGAKRTVLATYLKKAHRRGARIFTEAAVQSVEPVAGGGWLVRFDVPGAAARPGDPARFAVRADIVVLAAGTLGSTEILLRSSDPSRGARRLALSPELGRHFTGNGDVLAIAYNCDTPIEGLGAGDRHPDPQRPVGPCITGVIDLRRTGPPELESVVQEGSIPGALRGVIPAVLGGAAALWGTQGSPPPVGGPAEPVSRWGRYLAGGYRGAARRTQVFLVMAHDDAGGRMTLEDDRLRIHWPGVAEQPIFAHVHERLARATAAVGGTYVASRFRPVTVHPLGGCRMGDDAGHGVVDHRGRVFDDDGGVHPGLYVCDGSVIPRSLGVNPLLTIAALAERTCDLLLHPHWRFP